ncbi:MAG: CPXCG motif-containing cysteine-rich protein, partial [Cyanobacteria bacterium J06638_38]
MQTTAEYICAFCGESNSTFVDLSTGMQQSYTEDCQVCCRPKVTSSTEIYKTLGR